MKYKTKPTSKTMAKWQDIIFTICAAVLIPIPSHATRCEGGLVNEGNNKYEVHNKCGEPAFIDSRQIERVKNLGNGEFARFTVQIEEWTYDFGPNRFIRIFTFEDGKLVEMKNGIYGKSSDEDNAAYSRKNRVIQTGDTKYEVIIKLGRPEYTERREIERSKRTRLGDLLIQTIPYEEWTYNFGPRRLIRHVIFENGRVVRVGHGDYSTQ